MEGNQLFFKLHHYIKSIGLNIELIYDKYTADTYTVLGGQVPEEPIIFLEKKKGLGNIDVYQLQIQYNSVKLDKEKLRTYVKFLNHFLIESYSEESSGYILYYKRTIENESKKPLDIFETFNNKYHKVINERHKLFPFFNNAGLEWIIVSSHKEMKEEIEIFHSLYKSVYKASKSKDMLLHNYHLVNSDNLFHMIMFKYKEVQYHISVIKQNPVLFELRISGQPHLLPFIFSDTNQNLIKLVEEVENKNKVLRLFQKP